MRFLIALGSFVFMSMVAMAQVPACLGQQNQVLPVNNDMVLNWKRSTHNQYRNRGHIYGSLARIYPDKTGHHHLEVQIGQNAGDTIEVIYNEDFGKMPELHLGSVIEACGDYITANAQAGGYPPSPAGAIVHWVHMSPNPGHASGYVVVDGVVCGQDAEDAGPHQRRR